MNKRRVTAAMAAVLLSLSFSTVAYASGGDSEDTTTPPPSATVELPVVEEPLADQPFTPDGTGTVIDNATDEEGKEFYTIMTPSENVFYLVIDRQRSTENVYFLNAVTEADLLALAEITAEQEPVPTPEPTDPGPTPEEEQPEQPAKKSNTGLLVIVLVLAVVGGGAAYYFKVLRPKQHGQPEDDLDEAEYMEADTTEEDDGPPWDVEDEDTGEGSR